MESVRHYIELYKIQRVKLIKPLRKSLSGGFKQQKGKMFGSGSGQEADSKYRVDLLPAEKLRIVPVHNLAEERSVGWTGCSRGRSAGGGFLHIGKAQKYGS